MPTLQDEFYTVGTVGFPVHIQLLDKINNPLVLDNTVVGIVLIFTRPDKSTFSRTLVLPGAIFNANTGVIEYILQNGDLTLGGSYGFKVTLTFTGSRILPLKGTMKVLD